MTEPPRNFHPDRPKVFLSYARDDGEVFARDIRGRLVRDAPDLRLWRDREAMEGGVNWWRQITEALDVVEVMLLVLTPRAISSKVVTREWRYARQQGVHIYPVHGWPGVEIDFSRMPRWMAKAHAYHHQRMRLALSNTSNTPPRLSGYPTWLKSPAALLSVPKSWTDSRALLLTGDNRDPVAIVTSLFSGDR